jgi:hypothetical protein
MDESSQGSPAENPPEPGSGCGCLLILLLYGAMLVFSPASFFVLILFALVAFSLSLFLKPWFSSWGKALKFSQELIWWLFVGALVVFTFLHS